MQRKFLGFVKEDGIITVAFDDGSMFDLIEGQWVRVALPPFPQLRLKSKQRAKGRRLARQRQEQLEQK